MAHELTDEQLHYIVKTNSAKGARTATAYEMILMRAAVEAFIAAQKKHYYLIEINDGQVANTHEFADEGARRDFLRSKNEDGDDDFYSLDVFGHLIGVDAEACGAYIGD